jgi:hypothetical protein
MPWPLGFVESANARMGHRILTFEYPSWRVDGSVNLDL